MCPVAELVDDVLNAHDEFKVSDVQFSNLILTGVHCLRSFGSRESPLGEHETGSSVLPTRPLPITPPIKKTCAACAHASLKKMSVLLSISG